MTRQECLRKTIKLWDCLTEHPEMSAQRAYAYLRLPEDIHDCPCCTYDEQELKAHDGKGCDYCPMIDFWPGGCMNITSYYAAWWLSDKACIRQLTALKIRDAAIRELEKETPL